MNATLRKNVVSIIKFIGIVLCFYGLFRLFNYLSYDKDWVTDSTWVEVPGRLTVVGHSKIPAVFSYEYGGRYYNSEGFTTFSVPGNTEMERYTIKVNPNKPDHYSVVEWKPFFQDDEKRDSIRCEISSMDDGNYPMVFFEYSVNSKKYHRAQYLPPDFKTAFPNLKEHNWYLLEYWIVDPQRAIIHLDKPLK